LFFEENWILCGTRRLLWLPPDYRRYWRAEVFGEMVILRHNSGSVTMLQFTGLDGT